MTKLLCVYHADCADGFAAAWAVHRRFGDEVEFVAAKYGDMPELSQPCRYHTTYEPCTDCLGTGYEMGGGPFLDRDVLIVDFSYPRATLEAMAREARSVLVLDHHSTAAKDLGGIQAPPTPYASKDDPGWWELVHSTIVGVLVDDRVTFPPGTNLAALFDMNRSGAGLAWDYLHSGAPRPRIIDLVEDRDLWRFAHDPDTRQFHAVAASYGYEATEENFARWDRWTELADSARSVGWGSRGFGLEAQTRDCGALLNEGEAILRAERKLVEGIVRGTSRTMRIAGYVVPVACCPGALASEVGNALCAEVLSETLPDDMDVILGDRVPPANVRPYFSATYYDGADSRRHFSLRSPEGGADVGQIAREVTARINQRLYGANWRGLSAPTAIYGGGGHPHAAGFDAPLGWEGE